MEKRVELSWLMDFYGPLLTAHRLELVRLYCEEDLSLAEIAGQMGISRQGVYDAVRKAAQQLEAYEHKLGLLARYRQVQAAVEDCRAQLIKVRPQGGCEQALGAAQAALERIEWIER